MTTNTALQLCKNHGIAVRFESGVLMVREDYSKDGEYFYNWIPCPASYRDLMFWLGY